MADIHSLITFLYSYSKVLVHKLELTTLGFTEESIDEAINQASLYPLRPDSEWFLVLPFVLNTTTVSSDGSTVTVSPKFDKNTLTQEASDPRVLLQLCAFRLLLKEFVTYFAELGFPDIPDSLMNLIQDEGENTHE